MFKFIIPLLKGGSLDTMAYLTKLGIDLRLKVIVDKSLYLGFM